MCIHCSEAAVRQPTFFFSYDQAALWMVQSACPSVCQSVTTFWQPTFLLRPSSSMYGSVRLSVHLCFCDTFFTMFLSSHHHESFSYFQVITIDRSNVHAKSLGQGSKVRVTKVMTPLSRFRTVTLASIHMLQWNYAQSFVLLRRGALSFLKVIRQISRSHGSNLTQIGRFWTVTPVWIHKWLRNDAQSLK